MAWRLAHGQDRRRPGLATAEFPRTASADLSPSVETMEPVLFLVRAALDRLLTGLVADGRAAATLAITLTLDDARGASLAAPVHTITREIRLAHPMARLVPLFERCRALLDRWTLPAPVCALPWPWWPPRRWPVNRRPALSIMARPRRRRRRICPPARRAGAEAIVIPVRADIHRPEPPENGWR